MNTTSSQLPICVHCGTPRPADETLCPTCGKPWIDTTIPPTSAPETGADTRQNDDPSEAGTAVAGAAVAAAAASTQANEGTAHTEDADAETTDTAATDSTGSTTDQTEEPERDAPAAGAVIAGAAVAGATASAQTNSGPSGNDADTDTTDTDSTDSTTDQTEEPERDAPAAGAVIAGAAVAGATASTETNDGPAQAEAARSESSTPDHNSATVTPPPPPFGPDDTGEFAFDAWTQPVEEEPKGKRTAWLVPAGIGVAILAAVAFLVFSGNNTPSTTTVAALATTITSGQTPSTLATTTSQASTTTAIAFPPPGDWPPKGDPIDTADLTLKQSAIGPIDIGAPIDDVAGALTASLGEATASGVDGLCPPDEAYWLQFGQLTAIFDGFESSSVFVSYRYDEPEGTDPELGLETLSGIAIGDTVDDLINTYTQFTIAFEIIDSKDYFRLSDGADLLLWGPVSSADPAGLIEGIYSPTPCETTP